jgi:hypothetical protein
VALGRVLIAEEDPDGAARELRAAIRGWREVGAPYEIARARALLSRAVRALADEETADLELRAAHDEFVRLGARLDATATERELRDHEDRRMGPTQVRKTFLFTDIVGSTTLAEALGDVAWERLLRWHDDTLRALFSSGGGEIVNSTGDGYFVAFESARSGIDCAISVQRALATAARPRASRSRSGSASTRRGEPPRGRLQRHGRPCRRARRGAGGGEEIWPRPRPGRAGDDITTLDRREAAVRGASAKVSLVTIAWA